MTVRAAAFDCHVGHVSVRRGLRVHLLPHRTGILVLLAAVAVHRAFAVFAAVGFIAVRAFVMFSVGVCVMVFHHLAVRRRRLSIRLRLIVSESDRREREHENGRERDQNSFFHDVFSFQNLETKPRNLPKTRSSFGVNKNAAFLISKF
jgi:hypothetical protein